MLYSTEKKVTGGKLVRVKIVADEYIKDIQVSGDFFLYPEESILKIEQNLRSLHVSTSEEEIYDRIENTIQKEKSVFIGLRPEDLAYIIAEALKNPAQN